MRNSNPEGGSPLPEASGEFTFEQLQALLSEAKISKSLQDSILKDFVTASPGQKEWLKKRLETIISSSGLIQQAHKKTLLADWSLRKNTY